MDPDTQNALGLHPDGDRTQNHSEPPCLSKTWIIGERYLSRRDITLYTYVHRKRYAYRQRSISNTILFKFWPFIILLWSSSSLPFLLIFSWIGPISALFSLTFFAYFFARTRGKMSQFKCNLICVCRGPYGVSYQYAYGRYDPDVVAGPVYGVPAPPYLEYQSTPPAAPRAGCQCPDSGRGPSTV